MRNVVTGLVFLLVLAGTADAACRLVDHLGQNFTVCTFDPAVDTLRVASTGRDGKPYGAFVPLVRELRQEREYLRFAMNGGMYERDLSPVGLLVIGGVERKALDRAAGWGNFYLKPNGVFYIKGKTAGVLATETYAGAGIRPDFATQSGPMLVIDGTLHPAFLPDSDSLKIRNGVGIDADGRVVFALSQTPVRFHDFATLFRNGLHCRNALFLDGSISSLFVPRMNHYDHTFPLGPIITVTGQQ